MNIRSCCAATLSQLRTGAASVVAGLPPPGRSGAARAAQGRAIAAIAPASATGRARRRAATRPWTRRAGSTSDEDVQRTTGQRRIGLRAEGVDLDPERLGDGHQELTVGDRREVTVAFSAPGRARRAVGLHAHAPAQLQLAV